MPAAPAKVLGCLPAALLGGRCSALRRLPRGSQASEQRNSLSDLPIWVLQFPPSAYFTPPGNMFYSFIMLRWEMVQWMVSVVRGQLLRCGGVNSVRAQGGEGIRSKMRNMTLNIWKDIFTPALNV
nr:hypothetical protein Iba_chr06bCG13700 [Ipomoea batatas]